MLPIHFAPLQGYTEDAYRRIHHTLVGSVTRYYSPFVRLENGGVRSKDMRDILPAHNEGIPLTPQLIASDGNELKRLLEVVLPLGYEHIDLNLGCPFPLQTRHGRGAGILPFPDKVKELMQVVEEHPEVQFSVKMRLGLDDEQQWRAILPLLNDTPLEHITLHPRIATQQYKGEVNRAAFEEFLHECHHPVIYNGDITRVAQLQALEYDYPTLAGVMIGRGLLARPSLALEYAQGHALSDNELLSLIRLMHSHLLAHFEKVIPTESQRLMKIRTFWDYMEPTLGRKVWKKIVKAGNMKNYLSAIG